MSVIMGVKYVVPANMLLEILMLSTGYFIYAGASSSAAVPSVQSQADSLFRFTASLYIVTSIVWMRYYLFHVASASSKARMFRGIQAIFLAFVAMWTIMNATKRHCGGDFCENYEWRIVGGALALIDACIYTLRPNKPVFTTSPAGGNFIIPTSGPTGEVYVIANVHSFHIDTSPPSYDDVAPPDYATAIASLPESQIPSSAEASTEKRF